jgi:ABC-type glycerol-3-phosphate transport system substrate-binding protein
MLESLSSTSKVAPQSLPDLVLLSDAQLHNGFNSNLIYTYPFTIPSNDDPDWYNLVEELGNFNQQTYSLPVGVDGLLMVYNSRLIESQPLNWDDILRSAYLFSFPAADPEALYTHALYLSEGGELISEDGSVQIQAEALTPVLDFYSQAGSQTLLPGDIAQLDTDQKSWDKFIYGGRQVTVTWASRYFSLVDDTLTASPLLTQEGSPITLVKGWGWALTTPDPNKQLVAAELARYLTEADFIGEWTQAAHLLPLRPNALTYWSDDNDRMLASQLMPAAAVIPANDILEITGDYLSTAVIQTLTGELTAQEAAEQAAQGINQ